jgi:hypothetical protein
MPGPVIPPSSPNLVPAKKTRAGKEYLVSEVVKLPREILNLATFEAKRRERSRAYVLREWITEQAAVYRAKLEQEQAAAAAQVKPGKRVSKRS